jgi:TolB-like protein/Tfp pilus assembly protein PilF
MSDKPGFFEELKRRNVVRVGVVYLIAAWLLAQVADLMLASFHAPDWVIQAILVVLIIGFPLALIFAWAYELTPEGLKREKDVDRSQSITHKTGHLLDRSIIAILVVALGYFVWESQKGSQTGSENHFRETGVQEITAATENGSLTPTAPPAAENGSPAKAGIQAKSIAVLPFVNMSSDPEQEFFSDGISEEILNALAKVKELKVAGRTSSFSFKGKDQDLRQIGQTLGVEHILEGSVRKSGNTVRITAQLIQVEDGFHLWSETYDRELDDVFAIQDEIATAILEQLKAALIGFESEPVVAAATRTDSEVYDGYLLAKQRLYERKRLSIESAAELLDKAMAKDPDYAPAYALRGIAELLLSERNYGDKARAEVDTQGKLYLDKALQLDPQLAEAWAGLGLYHINRPGESTEAIDVLEKALAINPNLIDASNWLQIAYGAIGDNQRAMTILEDMVSRDPLYPPGFGNAINGYNLFGQHEKSWALLERIRPFLPGDPQVLQSEAATWMSLGHPAKALPLLVTALQSQASDAVMRNFRGWSLLQTGQFERALEEGQPWHQALALSVLNRQEEALMTAQKVAGEGIVAPLIDQLDRTGQHRQLVDFLESRWADLGAFESEYPDDGTGYGMMLQIARAYSSLGNEHLFNDAMTRVRAAHDRNLEQGVKDFFFLAAEAHYYVLAGDPDRAVSLLGQAVDQGLVLANRFELIWPAMQVLAGDHRFEAIQAKMFEHMNSERAELGLEPLST